MAPGSFIRDTTTMWEGTYVAKGFFIRASGPDNIYTRETTRRPTITQANPGIRDGAYVFEESSVKAIGLASITCDGKRQLTLVDIVDRGTRVFIAKKMRNNEVITYSNITAETGPASPEDTAYVVIRQGEKIVE